MNVRTATRRQVDNVLGYTGLFLIGLISFTAGRFSRKRLTVLGQNQD